MGPKSKPLEQNWILLIHQLPPRPTNLRVRIWRKLQKLGAVAIKNSVYVLPATEQAHEDFQWLKQEIESAGGEAAVFRAGSVEGATDEEIIVAFRTARDEDFAVISAEFDGLTGAIREQSRSRHLSAGRLSAHEAEIDKLHAELERVAANDFFDAAGRAAAFNAYERCQKVIRVAQGPTERAASSQAKGLNAIIDGLSKLLRDDRKLLQQTGTVFDGLYALLSKQAEKKTRAETHSGKRAKKR